MLGELRKLIYINSSAFIIMGDITLDNLSKLGYSAGIIITVMMLSLIHMCFGQVVVEDAMGRKITIENPPMRVVSLAPSITEVLATIGVDDVIIGADTISLMDSYMELGAKLKSRGVEDVGGYWWSSISIEKILDLRPDMVLADLGAHRPIGEALESYNITVVFLHGGSAKSINDVYCDIYNIALIFNKVDEAENLIKTIDNALNNGKELLRNYIGLRVLVVIDIWQGIWIAGRATYVDDLLTRLGLVNVATTVGWSSVSVEKIASWDPDLLIVASQYITDEVIAQTGLNNLGKPIVLLNETEVNIVSRPGPLLQHAPQVIHEAIKKGLSINESRPYSKSTSLYQDTTLGSYAILTIVAMTSGSLGYFVGLKKGRKH